MPEVSYFPGSVKLTILEGGRVDYFYFSPEEISNYKFEGDVKWPGVDKSRIKFDDEPEYALSNVVKYVTKKVFLDQKNEGVEVSAGEFEEELTENYEEVSLPISDIENLERELNKYIESENFEKAAEIRDKIKKRRDTDSEGNK